jgi:uncharacterized membrane protein
MSAKMVTQRARRRRRTITYLWIAALAILTVALIYWELTALLYVLATLGVTVLLVVVALTDLAHAERAATPISAPDQPAVIGSGTNANATVSGKSDWGARKRI